jgi:hypothetical protein
MNRYMMLFRGTKALTESELKQRGAAIQEWVATVRQKGIALEARNLDQVVGTYTLKDGEVMSEAASKDPALATIVSFDAVDDEAARAIAEAHPGLHYGVILELRRWLSPAPRS